VVAFRRHRDDALRSYLADDAADRGAHVERRLDTPIGEAEPVQVGDADDLGGLGLFALADLDHLAPAHRGIVPTGVAARDEAVLHVDAFVGPHGDGPGAAEV